MGHLKDDELEVVTRSKSVATAYRYRFKGAFGWAIFTINDQTGELSIQSDWGNFSNRWNVRHIGCDTLTEFIATCADSHYLAEKLSVPHHAVDVDGTIAAMRGVIVEKRLEYRQSRMIGDKDLFRTAWKQADTYAGQNGDAFWLWLQDLSSLDEILGEEPWFYIQQRDSVTWQRITAILDIFRLELRAGAFDEEEEARAG